MNNVFMIDQNERPAIIVFGAVLLIIMLVFQMLQSRVILKAGQGEDLRGIDSRLREERRISINTAEAAELTFIPGVGDKLSLRIVRHRSSHGPFRGVEDLIDVKGIGPSSLVKMKGFIRTD